LVNAGFSKPGIPTILFIKTISLNYFRAMIPDTKIFSLTPASEIVDLEKKIFLKY